MEVDTAEIAAQVRRQMATYSHDYRQTARPETLLGSPLPLSQVEQDLAEMQRALVDPYWLMADILQDVRELDGQKKEDCLIVADDQQGYLLAYVPSMNGFTVVREYQPGRFGSFGLDGDAVGAFISR